MITDEDGNAGFIEVETASMDHPNSDALNGIETNVAGVEVKVSRKEVKKEGRLRKMLAMLSTTVLSVKTALREDIYTAQIFIGSSTALIVPPNANRLSITLRNIGSNNVYIGSYGVNTTTGFFLRPYESLSLDRSWGALYGISDSDTGTIVNIVEE